MGKECVDSKCVVPCKDSLRQPITDIWGVAWDGLERAVDTRASAEAACAAGGARLPLATELFRVAATQSATVGQTNHTNYLWSRTPSDPGHTISVRLSDANTLASDSSVMTKLNFRCVCEPAVPATFTGAACNGPPSAGCFAAPWDGMRYNIDAADRAPLPKSSAMWECQQAHAHLADYNTYAESIQAKLPKGSNAWLHTADDGTYTSDIVVRWKDDGTGWVVNGNTSVDPMTNPHQFRCAGLNYAPGASSVHPANEFVEAPSGYKSGGADEAPVDYATAHDVCFKQGGHLARSTELGNLITAGLPGGAGKVTWTADAAGFGPAGQFLTMAVVWKDKLPIHPYAFTNMITGGIGWAYKSDPAYGFRCVFYPIDQQYSAPADANCNGGCFQLRVADSPSTMWFDKLDRGAATLEGAIAGCRAKGAHLPSERDLTEAIRNGLPSGSNAYLLTWDMGFGSPGGGPNAAVVRWQGEDRKFNDLYPTYMSWFGPGGMTPYRCMWTNELR
jgi:hypothetical protein